MKKIKLTDMEAAFLRSMWTRALRYLLQRRGQVPDMKTSIFEGECWEIYNLVDKFDKAFEISPDAITTTFERYKTDIKEILSFDGITKKGDKWFNKNINSDVALKIIKLHTKEMMDKGYYETFTEDEKLDYLRIFGGTFGHERGEMVFELLEVIENELKRLEEKP